MAQQTTDGVAKNASTAERPKAIHLPGGIDIPLNVFNDHIDAAIAEAQFTPQQLAAFAHTLSDLMAQYPSGRRTLSTANLYNELKNTISSLSEALIIASAKRYPQNFSVKEDYSSITLLSAMPHEG